MALSASDAAFEGFRVVRRNPVTLVFWALFYIATMALAFGLAGGGIARLMAFSQEMEQGGTPALEDLAPLGQAYLSVMALMLPLGLISGAVLNAAIVRAVLHPEDKAWGYLRFGMDEVRVLGVSLGLGVAFGVVSLIAVFLLGVIAGLVGAANAAAGVLVGLVGGLALACAAIWLLIRFCLAIPITFAEKRLAFVDSFRLTKGHFWPLLGMAVIALVMMIVVSLLGSLVFLPLQMSVGGIEDLAAYDGQGMLAILQAAWPMIIAWIVIQSVISALQLAVLYAPFSAAYRDLGPAPATAAR